MNLPADPVGRNVAQEVRAPGVAVALDPPPADD